MTPQETLNQLHNMRRQGQCEDVDNILISAIDRIENVLQAESELEDWASGELFQRAQAERYGVHNFILGASL